MAKRGRPPKAGNQTIQTECPPVPQPEYVSPFDQILYTDGFQDAKEMPGRKIILWGLERGPDPGTCFLHRMVLLGGLVVNHKVRTWDIRGIQIGKATGYMEGEDL